MTSSVRETASQMSKAITTSIMKQQDTTKSKQQLLAKEVLCPQFTKFRREGIKTIISLYQDETWSADLID